MQYCIGRVGGNYSRVVAIGDSLELGRKIDSAPYNQYKNVYDFSYLEKSDTISYTVDAAWWHAVVSQYRVIPTFT